MRVVRRVLGARCVEVRDVNAQPSFRKRYTDCYSVLPVLLLESTSIISLLPPTTCCAGNEITFNFPTHPFHVVAASGQPQLQITHRGRLTQVFRNLAETLYVERRYAPSWIGV